MCVILICEEKRADIETLLLCEQANKDGGGIAWVSGDYVEYKKAVTAQEIFEISCAEPLPQIIHFRLGTVGGNGKLLCHPFPVSKKTELALEGQAKKVLFHNGHWSRWKEFCTETIVQNKEKAPKGKWSDSRAMAWLAAIYGESFLNFIGEKVVVFSSKAINIYGEGWIEKVGVVFSNLNWEVKSYALYSQFSGYNSAGLL